MRITASDVSRAVSGTLLGQDVPANGFGFDSRALEPNQAFVAIMGQRDGHEYLLDASLQGARFALVQRGRAIEQITCIEVDDTLVALGAIGQMCRERLGREVGQRVVGITGSAGKTSTKNLIHAVLSIDYENVHASLASLNNDIGVPITIINAPDDCDALIVEMGMRGLGEIERLCQIAQPSIGVITNVGDAHSDRVGGIEGVAQAKGELIECLSQNGIAILNVDDPRVIAMSSRTWANVMTYGSAVGADVRYSSLEVLNDGRVRCRFDFDGDSAITTPLLPGLHMAANAAAAIATGIAAGMSLESCVLGIGQEISEQGRVRWKDGINSSRILDDVYNANSSSMAAALQVLASSEAHRRFAVLGPMFELADSKRAHLDVAALAKDLGIELLGFETDLYGVEQVSINQLVARLGLEENDTVLVKGSRDSKMERVVEVLVIA